MFIPMFSKMFSKLTGYKDFLAPEMAAIAFLQPYIDSHFSTHVSGQPRDFLDSYIDEMKNTKDPASSFHIDKSKLEIP
jgi:hypothetical protein